MGTYIGWFFGAAAAAWAFMMWRASGRLKRAEFIRTYNLPRGLYEKLRQQRPGLDFKDCALVARGLRQFFLAYLNSGRKMVAMPSQVVDELWHEFILYTREYHEFCHKAFGGFLHHTPAVMMGATMAGNEGLRRVWWHACKEENIHPRKPSRLPLLFALDGKLKIENGFIFVPDCSGVRRKKSDGGGDVYCGGDFGSTSFDGTLDGLGNGSSGDHSFGFSFSCGGGGDSGGGGCGGD